MTANAFEMGMNDHIAKPIDVEKVEEVLVALLKEYVLQKRRSFTCREPDDLLIGNVNK